MKHLFEENNIKYKQSKILNTYMKLLKENNYKSKSIMLLVPNNNIKLNYESKIDIEFSEDLNIITYLNFVKKELVKFWPIVVQSCERIKKDVISPIFINSSLTDYIISNKVKTKRNLDGYFEDITGTNKNISMSINTNINKAALSLIDFNTIGEKLYLSKKNKDSLTKFSYSQMNEIINYYINKLLENSMIDNSLCIYLYNKYLLNSEIYKDHLKKETNYLIVDSLESCSSAEVDFIKLVQDYAKDTYIYFNSTRDYSVFNNIDMEYIYENILKNYDIDEIKYDKNQVTNILGKNKIGIQDIFSLPVNIHLNECSQLYNEMIGEVCNKVLELVENGISAKDIAIISPINNTILDYQINNKLEKSNIEVFNTKKDKKIIDYPYSNTLVVASCIFYDYTENIKDEEYISFIEILLDVNRIQAFKIYKNKDESEELNELLKYISNKKDEKLKISEFLMKFYIDKMLNLKYGKENVHICKQIIHESEVFTENISLLGLDKSKDKEKIFIDALKSIINDYFSIAELRELNECDKVVITTPYSYISSIMDRPIQLWVDIGSNAWNMKIEKDISNIIVLRKSFKDNKVYSDKIEEEYKKYYLYNMIYNLLINAKTVYAYKSEYTVNGYIQESILYSLLLKIVDNGGNFYE